MGYCTRRDAVVKDCYVHVFCDTRVHLGVGLGLDALYGKYGRGKRSSMQKRRRETYNGTVMLQRAQAAAGAGIVVVVVVMRAKGKF